MTLCGASDRLTGVVHLAGSRHVHPVNLAAIYQLPVHDSGVTVTHTVFGFGVTGVVQLEVVELTSFRRRSGFDDDEVVIYIGVMCKLATVSRFTCS